MQFAIEHSAGVLAAPWLGEPLSHVSMLLRCVDTCAHFLALLCSVSARTPRQILGDVGEGVLASRIVRGELGGAELAALRRLCQRGAERSTW